MMNAAAHLISPAEARTLCTLCILSGKPPPDLRAWVQHQASAADETDTSPAGALRVALWWLAEADADWRLLAHAGKALADALLAVEGQRANRYAYAVGSAGQVHR